MMWRLNRRCTEKVTKLVTWCNLRDQSRNKHFFTSDDNKPTNNVQTFVLHVWCPHPSFFIFYFIFDVIQLVVTSADNNAGLIFSIKLNEPVGTGDQVGTKPGALSHQWPKKKQHVFLFWHFEHSRKQSYNRETISYTDFNVAKRTETETEKPND